MVRRLERGLSVAETIVAGSLLCLLLIAVLNLFPTALTTVGYSKDRTRAAGLAQDALELVASRPFSTLAVGVQDVSPLPLPAGTNLEVVIEEVPGHLPEYLLNVRSTVTWNYQGRPRICRQELYVHPARY